MMFFAMPFNCCVFALCALMSLGTSNGQYKKEDRLYNGTVIGTEAWITANNTLKIINYIADHGDYRITNSQTVPIEPGTNIEDAMEFAKAPEDGEKGSKNGADTGSLPSKKDEKIIFSRIAVLPTKPRPIADTDAWISEDNNLMPNNYISDSDSQIVPIEPGTNIEDATKFAKAPEDGKKGSNNGPNIVSHIRSTTTTEAPDVRYLSLAEAAELEAIPTL